MSPSSALQKLASSLGSGASGGHDSNPPSSGRGGAGVIRGFLQSLRGLSAPDSPRGSRGSRQGSQGQQVVVSNADSLHVEWEDSENEDIRSRPGSRLASGASGVALTPRTTGNGLSCNSTSNELSMVGIAAISSSPTSGRQSGRATPVASRENSCAKLLVQTLEFLRPEGPSSLRAPSTSRLSGTSLFGMANASEGTAQAKSVSSATSPPATSTGSLQFISPANPPIQEAPDAMSEPPITSSYGREGAAPRATIPHKLGFMASTQRRSLDVTPVALAQPAPSLEPYPLKQGPRMSSQRRSLDFTPVTTLRAPSLAPPRPCGEWRLLAPCQSTVSEPASAVPSPPPDCSGVETQQVDDGSITHGTFASNLEGAVRSGEDEEGEQEVVIVQDDDEGVVVGLRHKQEDELQLQPDEDAVAATAPASTCDIMPAALDPTTSSSAGSPGHHRRNASVEEVSAVKVSKAVQRLQQRQQQEKAAARLFRTSPAGHTSPHHHRHHHNLHPHRHHSGSSYGNGVHSSHSANGNDGYPLGGPTTHRVLSAAADAATLTADGAGSGMPSSCSPPQSQMHLLSPARRLSLLQTGRSGSNSSPFQHHHQPGQANYQRTLYDGHMLGASNTSPVLGTSPLGNIGFPSPANALGLSNGSSAGPENGAAANGNGHMRGHRASEGLDELLGGDVPDMSRGRLGRGGMAAGAAGGSLAEVRSSVSYTEGRVSAAERLQAMVSSAAGSGDAANYLQQLLIPDAPSTASVELQYSGTAPTARMPSVLALAYGSNSGPVSNLYGSNSGVWGGYGAGGSPLGPGSQMDGMAAATYGSGVSSRVLRGSGTAYGANQPTADWGTGSGSISRMGSGFLGATASGPVPSSACPGYPTSVASANGSRGGRNSRASDASGLGSCVGSAGAVPCLHAGKSASELVRELRDLCAAAPAMSAYSARPTSSPAGIHVTSASAHAAFSGDATMEERSSRGSSCRTAMTDPRVITVGGGDGGGDGLDGPVGRTSSVSAADCAAMAATAVQRQVLRDELVAALWRLLHAKDGEAVTYLLGEDPAAGVNRSIAPLLNDMRSWVYLNMW